MFGKLAIIALVFTCLCAPVVGAVEQEQWPLLGRNQIPKAASLFLEVSAEVDTRWEIHIIGDNVKVKGGEVHLIAPLPRRRSVTGEGVVHASGSPGAQSELLITPSASPSRSPSPSHHPKKVPRTVSSSVAENRSIPNPMNAVR